MKYKSKELKKMARIVLNKNWGYPIFLTLLYTLIIMGISVISSFFGLGTTTYAKVLAWIAAVVVSLISSLFAVGVRYAYMNLSRNKVSTLNDLFVAFHMSPDRFLIVGLIIELPAYLMMLPTYLMPDIVTESPYLYLGITLTANVLTILFACFFCLSNYLLLDYPEMSALESLRLSIRLMKGYKGKYFYLSLSFIGWVLLSIFTLCISLFWIEPYMHMTLAFFYITILKNAGLEPERTKSADDIPTSDTSNNLI